NRIFLTARTVANAVALEICRDDSAWHRRALGAAKAKRRRHRMVGGIPAALGAYVDRGPLGIGNLQIGPSDVLVVPAGAAGDVVFDPLERSHQPHKPRLACSQFWTFSYA